MLIIRRPILYFTASGIITLKQVSGLKLLKYNSIFIELYFSNFQFQFDDTRGCVKQF